MPSNRTPPAFKEAFFSKGFLEQTDFQKHPFTKKPTNKFQAELRIAIFVSYLQNIFINKKEAMRNFACDPDGN